MTFFFRLLFVFVLFCFGYPLLFCKVALSIKCSVELSISDYIVPGMIIFLNFMLLYFQCV